MISDVKFLHEGLRNSARNFPNRAAFRFGNKELSFSELSYKSNHVSDTLINHGLKKGDRVGILMNRCLETSFAIYGVLQSGGIYVPIDASAPSHKIAYILQECAIDIVITTLSQRRIYQHLTQEIILLDSMTETSLDSFECPWEIKEEDEAYILYTSGSTGSPKGIVHTHKSGCGFAKLCVKTFKIDNHDRIANHAPIFFDISTLAYFAGPLSGACTIIISDAHTIMAASMAELIMEEQITFWYSVPLALIQMKNSGNLEKKRLDKLKTILYAGEAFPVKQLRDFMKLLDNTKFINLYGPTETNGCTYHEVNELPDVDDTVPIGKVWDNTEFIIENEELLIHSVTNMLGYWKNEKLTSEVFKEVDGKTFYLTGDLVEEKEGLLYLKGRKDHQIKFRGFRIELGEIEQALLACDNVNEAVAIPIIENKKVVDIQVAVLTNGQIDEKKLATFAKQRLPKYAVPSQFFILEDFPRTRTGKVQRSEIMKLVS